MCIVPFLFYTLSGKRMAEINARLTIKRMLEEGGGEDAEESGEGKTVGWMSLEDILRDPAAAKNPDAAFGVVGRMSLDDMVAYPPVADKQTADAVTEEAPKCEEEIFVKEGCEPVTEEEKMELAEKQAVDEYEKGGDL